MASRSKMVGYLRLKGKYLKDVETLLEKGDFSQASEKLWGAAAEITKAVAARRGVKAKTHAHLWDFIIQLDRERPKLGLVHDFYDANHLHSNFYEDDLRPEVVRVGAASVKIFVEKMRKLL